VVPPGIEKAPNQAARISQSVKKCHLSDILAFFGFLTFLTFFTFSFSDFVTFLVFHFSDFGDFCVFMILSILTLFLILPFLSLFTVFYKFNLFLSFEKGILKIRPSFDLFLAPASTPMASTLGGSFLNGKKHLFFFLSFLKK